MEAGPEQNGAAATSYPERVARLLDEMARERGAARSAWGPIRAFDSLESTQSTLSIMESGGAPGGAVVIAGEQTAGRGRHGRTWHSPPTMGLYMSALVRPSGTVPAGPAGYSFAAAIAVCETARTVGIGGAEIKWPNDVLVGGRKLAGILVEGRISGDVLRAVLIGIGLNMSQTDGDFPPGIRSVAVSLEAVSPAPLPARALVCARILDRLDVWLETLARCGPAPILCRWRELSPSSMGKRVAVRGTAEPFAGVTMGIDDSGALLVRADDGRLAVLRHGEEVSIREVG